MKVCRGQTSQVGKQEGTRQDLDLQGVRFGEPGRRCQESQQLYKFMKKANLHTGQYRVTGYIKEYRVYIGQEVRQMNLCLKRTEMYKFSE